MTIDFTHTYVWEESHIRLESAAVSSIVLYSISIIILLLPAVCYVSAVTLLVRSNLSSFRGHLALPEDGFHLQKRLCTSCLLLSVKSLLGNTWTSYIIESLRETKIYENLPIDNHHETMFANEEMQRMSVSTTDSEIEDVTSFTVYPSMERHLLSYFLDGVILRIIGVVSIILLLYALLTVQTQQTGTTSNYDGRIFKLSKQSQDRPDYLREKLRSVSVTAMEDGALSPIAVDRIDYVVDNNIEVSTFSVSQLFSSKKCHLVALPVALWSVLFSIWVSSR